jgi:predicted dehydrogenase
MSHRFSVRAVYDAVQQYALREARRLGCRAAVGIIDLLERRDIDGVLFVDTAWHGLWPLEAASRFGKAVFSAVPLEADRDHAAVACQKAADAQLPVMPALSYRLAPASVRLQQLLRDQLGAARLLLCEHRGSKPGHISVSLLDLCAFLMDATVAHVRATAVEGASSIEEVWMDFGQGRAARVSRWAGSHVRPSVRVRIIAERGSAVVDLPRRLRWCDASGQHGYTAADSQPRAEMMLERFHQAVLSGQPMQPSLEDVRRAWGWLLAARSPATSPAKNASA